MAATARRMVGSAGGGSTSARSRTAEGTTQFSGTVECVRRPRRRRWSCQARGRRRIPIRRRAPLLTLTAYSIQVVQRTWSVARALEGSGATESTVIQTTSTVTSSILQWCRQMWMERRSPFPLFCPTMRARLRDGATGVNLGTEEALIGRTWMERRSPPPLLCPTTRARSMEGATRACFMPRWSLRVSYLGFCMTAWRVQGFTSKNVCTARSTWAPSRPSGTRSIWLSPGVVLFFAVALCSTVSRARDRRVPRRLVARGVPELPRLRSDDAPHGLPNLLVASPRDILRVRQDNAIAQFFGSLSLLLTSRGVAWALENPRRSYL